MCLSRQSGVGQTDHIREQIADIEKIEQAGYSYRTSDGIYFDTSKLPRYGYLARLDREGLDRGGAGRYRRENAVPPISRSGNSVRPINSGKMEWGQSPGGVDSRAGILSVPRWLQKYLGPSLRHPLRRKRSYSGASYQRDCPSRDLLRGPRLANYWLHGYFLETDKEKDDEVVRFPFCDCRH